MATRRRGIVSALIVALETITVANGYASNLGKAAGGAGVKDYLEEPSHLGEGDIGCLVMQRSGTRSDAQQVTQATMLLVAHCWVQFAFRENVSGIDRSGGDLIDALIADIEKAAVVDYTLGATCEEIRPQRWDIQGDPDAEAKVFAQVTFDVVYRHQYDDPSVAG